MATERICNHCGATYQPGPGGGRRMFCSRHCCNAVHNARMPRERKNDAARAAYVRGRAIIETAKQVPCIDCAVQFPPICMDFDHVHGDKADIIARMPTLTPRRIEAEIAKCEVRCSNCHRIRHWIEKGGDALSP